MSGLEVTYEINRATTIKASKGELTIQSGYDFITSREDVDQLVAVLREAADHAWPPKKIKFHPGGVFYPSRAVTVNSGDTFTLTHSDLGEIDEPPHPGYPGEE